MMLATVNEHMIISLSPKFKYMTFYVFTPIMTLAAAIMKMILAT